MNTQSPFLNRVCQACFGGCGTKPGAYHGNVFPTHEIDDPGFGVKAQGEEDGGERNEDTHQRYDTTVIPLGIDIIRGDAQRSWEDARGYDFSCLAADRHCDGLQYANTGFETAKQYVLLQTNPTSDFPG